MRPSAVTLILVLALASFSAPAAAQGKVPLREVWLDGSYVVHGREVHEDEIIHANGTIAVAPDGELVLRHVNLVFEGLAEHSLAVQPPVNGQVGALRIESTDAGSSFIQSINESTRYFFSSYGRLDVVGTPTAPVYIQNVTGLASNLNPSPTNWGGFINGMMLIGPHNDLDHVIFRACPSGIAVSSVGETRIAHSIVALVDAPLFLHHAHNVLVEDSQLGGYDAGIFADYAQNVTVVNSYVQAKNYGVIGIHSDMRFVNDTLRAADAAHVLADGQYLFDGDTFRGYNESGIHSHHDQALSLTVRNSTFEGNHVGTNAIVVESASAVRIEGNRILNHTGDGIAILSARDLVLSDNVAMHNGFLGVNVMDAALREDNTTSGDAPDGSNHEGVLSASKTTNITVLDEAGKPVSKANVTIVGSSGTPHWVLTRDDGHAQALLQTVWIGNDQKRVVESYRVTAHADGHPDGDVVYQPYLDGNDLVLRLGVQGSGAPQTLAVASAPSTGTLAILGGVAVVTIVVGVVAIRAIRSRRGAP